ncbi:MAG: hypothetical protein LBJ47_08040, partial [Tannerella sp.]|nr:hypothetical protein [Tannerella sp.]
MNRNITKIGSVLVCMAFGCLSLKGQEKAAVKMSAGEAAPGNEVDLRSWLPILADSSITYSANGTKVKRVYYDDNVYVGDAWGLYEEYVWENNQWSLLRDSVYFGQAGLYYNEESGSFTIPLHEVWWIRVPMPAHAATTRDENNRLISVTGKTEYFNFSVNVVYNANGKPVSVEEYITSITDNVGGLYYSSIYAYDAGGNLTFFEDHRFTVPTNPSWVWSDEFTA